MKKKIIITATFAACLALCAAVWPQAETVKETPLPSEMTAVTALQPTLQNTKVIPVRDGLGILRSSAFLRSKDKAAILPL